jgi:hypothetical protein
MKPATISRVSLLLLIVYCLDLAWKLPLLKELTTKGPWPLVILALAWRFAYMAGLFWAFVSFRRKAKLNESKN